MQNNDYTNIVGASHGEDEYYYCIEAIDNFIKTGVFRFNRIDFDPNDAPTVLKYVYDTTTDPEIKYKVLGNEINAQIFRDVMLKQIYQLAIKIQFRFDRHSGEEYARAETLVWDYGKRKHGWQALVSKLKEDYADYGFQHNFYDSKFQEERAVEDDYLWEKMLDDWKECVKKKALSEAQNDIDRTTRNGKTKLQLKSYFDSIPNYLSKEGVSSEEFSQAWSMMGGNWDTYSFNKYLKFVRLQKKYPDIERIVNMMGRVANDDGNETLSLTQGSTQPIEHSSRSDILGVTVGSNIDSLLPHELAQFTDDELSDLFLQKMLTGKLQVFRHKSEIMKNSKQKSKKKATRRGPLVMCVDSSDSMKGKPYSIAKSACISVVEIAKMRNRPCFLINFAVDINPIDIQKEYGKFVKFFDNDCGGGTEATRMMQATFKLLNENETYCNADVLWITDFKIPLPNKSLLDRQQELLENDTCFFGLQIGNADNEWNDYFTEIAQLPYTPSRFY